METHSDVLVLGGGPAGSATALLLARQGYQVTLVDRAQFPREKVCGDYLTPGAVGILRDSLGLLPELRAQGAVETTQEYIVAHDGKAFGGATQAMMCPRTLTDQTLLHAARAAGVSVQEGFNVREINFTEGQVTGITGQSTDGDTVSFSAQITVGADGTHSLLARELGVVRSIPRLQRIALNCYFQNGAARDIKELTMYLPTDHSDGCCGFGAPSGLDRVQNVTLVVAQSEAAQMAGRRQEYFTERLHHSFPQVWERLQDSSQVGDVRTVGCFGHETTRATHDGALLVGDAATFINPFTGEGVYFALRGAEMAAETIDRALCLGNTSRIILRSYDTIRRQELYPRYWVCDTVQRIVHTPRLLSWCGERLRRSAALTETVLKTVGDISSPRNLFSFQTLGHALATL